MNTDYEIKVGDTVKVLSAAATLIVGSRDWRLKVMPDVYYTAQRHHPSLLYYKVTRVGIGTNGACCTLDPIPKHAREQGILKLYSKMESALYNLAIPISAVIFIAEVDGFLADDDAIAKALMRQRTITQLKDILR